MKRASRHTRRALGPRGRFRVRFVSVKRSWLFVLPLAASLVTGAAAGRVEETCTYTKAQVFQSALRFIRVDNGFSLEEKDEASGYLIFDYPLSDGETTPGSFEVIEHDAEVQLVVRIPKLAEHHERLLVRRFFEKLKSEYGEPPHRKAAPEQPPKDADDEAPAEPAPPEAPKEKDRASAPKGSE